MKIVLSLMELCKDGRFLCKVILYISRCFQGRGVWLSLAMRLAKEGRAWGGPGAWEGRRGEDEYIKEHPYLPG